MSVNLQSRPYTPWQLIKSFWESEQAFLAYGLLFVAIAMSVALVGMDVAINYWYNFFYDALQNYDKRGAIDLLFIFALLASIYIVLAVYRYYVQSYLSLRWRQWLTNQYLTRWLADKSYYYLENFDETTDNPDQRIQEDISSLVTSTLDLSIGLITSTTTFFAFIYILWTLSGHFTLHLGSLTVVVPGYLVWVSIIYAIFGTWCAFKIGWPLVGLNFEQQRREANFRFAAIDLRSHAEHVALYRGETYEKNALSSFFSRVLENWYAIILRQKLLLWFTAGYNQVSVIVPLLVTLPNYFNKVFKLGGFMQALRAFQQIQEALSFFVNAYTQIAQWRAVVQRLITFLNHIYAVEHHAATHNQFVFKTTAENIIAVRHLNIYTPKDMKMLENMNIEFVHGKNYLIKGASGIGKSTLIRVIARIWPYGAGEIDLPAKQKIMYLPQKSYMPVGTLRAALLFPARASIDEEAVLTYMPDGTIGTDEILDVSDYDLKAMLKLCDLPELESRLYDVSMWSEQLSPGELQRVALVRVLLRKPSWVFLDESTSALDLPHEKMFYELIKSELPDCSVISVGHQPSVEIYHEIQIDLTEYSRPRVSSV
jgi:putative ATP-binding cassette transporter